jgi:magnesium transporter
MEENEKNPQQTPPEETQYGISEDLYQQINSSIEIGDEKLLNKILSKLHAADIADFINVISHEKRKKFIALIRKNFDPEILLELNTNVKEEIIRLLGNAHSATAITKLDTEDAVDFIEDLKEEGQKKLLEAIPKERRDELVEGLAYPEDSAGRLIDKKIVCVPEFWTVGQTLDFLKENRSLPEEFFEIFIVDPKMKPVGGVLLSRIIRSENNTLMKNITSKHLNTIKADMDQEEVAYIFRQYGLASAPVVNDENRIIGVITVDDIVSVIEEEAQEDILHLGGILETDLHSSFINTVKRRFPWLLVNLLTAVVASIVIWFFEGTIEKISSLAVLMPIVASMGGNAGTQTITVIVRAIATKELTTNNALRVVGKEILVGGLNGLLFAIISAVMVFIWYQNIILSITFAFATIVTLLLAGLAGTLIPIGLVKRGVDPAIASTVILTTVTDVIAFGAFLGMAAYILL